MRVFSLTPPERRRFADAVASLIKARWRLRFEDANTLRSWATPAATASAPLDDVLLAFSRALHVCPGSTCLARALALQRLLAVHGHASELTIGVTKDGDRLAAHAWLVRDGEILIGGGSEAGDKSILAIWPSETGTPPPAASDPGPSSGSRGP